MRFHLFEFTDKNWTPNFIRIGMTDYLRYFLSLTDYYKPIISLIIEALEKTKSNCIIDLCSGGGGVIEQVQINLEEEGYGNVSIILTDKYPNISAYRYINKRNSKISYYYAPAEAENLPKNLIGLRTMFSSAHHFRPEKLIEILKNSVENNSAICIFDSGDKSLFTILGIILFHPIGFLIGTPFFKPFKLWRIIFTYLIPIIPLCTVWDGSVSILRLHKPDELLKMAHIAEPNKYIWKSGKIRNKVFLSASYLIGYPKSNS